MGHVVGFFIKYLTQQKKNVLIVHFRNFQKFLQTLKITLTTKGKKAGKNKKRAKKLYKMGSVQKKVEI